MDQKSVLFEALARDVMSMHRQLIYAPSHRVVPARVEGVAEATKARGNDVD
jgi:hypothetical protein